MPCARWLGLLPVVLCASVLASKAPAKRLDVQDGFESPQLSALWATDRFEPQSIRLQSTIVRSGKQAVAVTVRGGDKFEAGQNGSADSERDELREADRLVSREGAAYEYSFSLFFPADFPIVPVRLVIAQWKQYCNGDDKPCSDDSPVLALRYINGELLVTQDIAHAQHILYRQKAEFRGRWLDFRIRARFTPQATGHEQLWLDGKQIVDFSGITADPENATTGYASPGHFFFKMGLYRNVMQQPMTVYIDEYRKRELTDGQ
jgi:hypothetical protein